MEQVWVDYTKKQCILLSKLPHTSSDCNLLHTFQTHLTSAVYHRWAAISTSADIGVSSVYVQPTVHMRLGLSLHCMHNAQKAHRSKLSKPCLHGEYLLKGTLIATQPVWFPTCSPMLSFDLVSHLSPFRLQQFIARWIFNGTLNSILAYKDRLFTRAGEKDIYTAFCHPPSFSISREGLLSQPQIITSGNYYWKENTSVPLTTHSYFHLTLPEQLWKSEWTPND